jgi:hypothetical protein
MRMIDISVPGPGEAKVVPIPDSFDGIRCEVGRLIAYIYEAKKDPLVLATAQKIAELSMGTARQVGRKLAKESLDVIQLRGIDAWCRARYQYVANPVGIEIIKTPARVLRELDIPEEIALAMWEPIRNSFCKVTGQNPKKLTLPTPKFTGTSAVATCLVLSLAAAIGISPIRMRFGGIDDSVHHVWANVYAGGRFYDVDIAESEFDKTGTFQTYQLLDVP